MNRYIDALRTLCCEDQRGVAPYTLRTRFERNLYGLVTQYSQLVLGAAPAGLTRHHIEKLLHLCRDSGFSAATEPIILAMKVFERFTYLCDTSNWSDDGQDPRIEMCREDILRLCDLINGLTDTGISTPILSAQK
jgi:hypothetical protein